MSAMRGSPGTIRVAIRASSAASTRASAASGESFIKRVELLADPLDGLLGVAQPFTHRIHDLGRRFRSEVRIAELRLGRDHVFACGLQVLREPRALGADVD